MTQLEHNLRAETSRNTIQRRLIAEMNVRVKSLVVDRIYGLRWKRNSMASSKVRPRPAHPRSAGSGAPGAGAGSQKPTPTPPKYLQKRRRPLCCLLILRTISVLVIISKYLESKI